MFYWFSSSDHENILTCMIVLKKINQKVIHDPFHSLDWATQLVFHKMGNLTHCWSRRQMHLAKCFGSYPKLPGVSKGVRRVYLCPALSVPVGSKPSNAVSYTGLVAWQKMLSRPLHTLQKKFSWGLCSYHRIGMVSFKDKNTSNLSAPLGVTSSRI